jgi:GDPmannose 4,6-dehydratase
VPRALITGITGQDGSYLAELLLSRGYEVVGLLRRHSAENHWRIQGIEDRLTLVYGDLTDLVSLLDVLTAHQPDEIYNLAAQSFVAESWKQPLLTSDVTGLGAMRLFESVRRTCPTARVYQASSSEMFGTAPSDVQSERTPFHPRSPYGVAKVFAHHAAVNYRESYGLWIACGVLFNHESPRRGLEFVTRKISDGVARIVNGQAEQLTLGNMSVARDWGHAEDYVEAMWRMLQHDEPDDFVVATGVSTTVERFAELAFACEGMDYRDYVVSDPALQRPAEIYSLRGDATRAMERLSWRPQCDLPQLVSKMVAADVARHRGASRSAP